MPNAEPLLVRRANQDDRDRLQELNRYGLRAAGVPLSADVYAGDLDDIDATYLTGRSTLLVAEIDGIVVAMGAVADRGQQVCEITRMRVDPAHQGHGYGRLMLEELERHAIEMGFQEANLLTGPDQHPAIDLYRSAGYGQDVTEQHGPLQGVRLRKELA